MNRSLSKLSEELVENKCLSAFLIIYLGPLPAYFDFWAKSCEHNYKNFHWFVYTDQILEPQETNPAVTLVPLTFYRLCKDMKNILGINIPVQNTRIVCDCRLMLYLLRKDHENLERYDFIGYSDLDVIYGRIFDFLPENMTDYSLIAGHEGRPCGPFTLFNKKYLPAICGHKDIKAFFEQDMGNDLYADEDYSDASSAFKPMSGNTTKDKIAQKINFAHLDESKQVVNIAVKFAPVFCSADPLQPTMTRGFNHRKAFAVWNKGQLYVTDIWGSKKKGAFFHFSRLKNRSRFKVNPQVLNADHFGIYKYGFIRIQSWFTKIKLFLTLLY